MNENKKIEFNQQWIGSAVKELLRKENIYESDMEKIKYLRIGEAFNLGFIVEMSLETPPDPFYDADGGDEWVAGSDGATLTGEFIPLFIDYVKGLPDELEYIDSDTKERSYQLTVFYFWEKYDDDADNEEEGEDWEDTVRKWRAFEKTIFCAKEYIERFEDDKKYDAWYSQTEQSIQSDLALFSGLEVLRMNGAVYQNFNFLNAMPRLRTLEVVESRFVSLEGIDAFARLKQVCCWWN